METRRLAPPRQRAAMWLLQGLMACGMLIASWLAVAHVFAAHGAGAFSAMCVESVVLGCGPVTTSQWGAIGGVPTSLYALPVQAMVVWLAAVGRRGDQRGERARRACISLLSLVLLASLWLLYVMVAEIGSLCLGCLTLDVIHLVAAGVAVYGAGNRRPAVPYGIDVFACFGLMVVISGTTFQMALIYGAKLDRAAAQAVMEPASAAVETEVQTARKPGKVVTLPSSVHDVPVDKYDPFVGPRRADVTVVTFGDYTCGFCKRLEHAIAPVRSAFSDRVRFVTKHFPLDTTCNSHAASTGMGGCRAALAAICAQDQRRFYPFHDLLYRNAPRFDDDSLRSYAAATGIDGDELLACMADPGAMEQLREDIAHGAYVKLDGTPRTFVNGRLFSGAVSSAMLEAAIEIELGERDALEDGRVRLERVEVVDAALENGPTPMVRVELGDSEFWIDAVESSVDAGGAAVALAGAVPALASWAEAKSSCEAAGKRMCTAREWISACQGADAQDDNGSGSVSDDMIEGREYPYGAAWQPAFCNDTASQEAGGALPTGTRAGCRTPTGIYDLSGNVQEWVGEQASGAALMGGAWYYEDKASCVRTNGAFGAEFRNRTTGFRCCSDAQVTPTAPDGVVRADAPRGQPGVVVPRLQGVNFDGESVELNASEGGVTVINFWASWCGPCRSELPALGAYAEANPGVAVFGVSVDRDQASAQQFLTSMAAMPSFPLIHDEAGAIASVFDVVSMPTTIVIAPDGKIHTRHEGWSEESFAKMVAAVHSLSADGE